jgi:hypothetical protein
MDTLLTSSFFSSIIALTHSRAGITSVLRGKNNFFSRSHCDFAGNNELPLSESKSEKERKKLTAFMLTREQRQRRRERELKIFTVSERKISFQCR